MRPCNAMGFVLLAALLASGCSRLTFIKPKLERSPMERTAPEYTVRESRDSKRIADMDRLVLAEQRLRAGELDEAEKEVRAVLKAAPDSADAHTVLAVIEEQRGHAEQAGVEYAKAMALAPERGGMLNNYGTWLCSNGRAAESLAYFDKALADPAYTTPAAALANAGSCALRAGQSARSDRDLRRAIALDPANPVALAALAESEYRAGNYLSARAFSERRLAAAPATPQVLQLASQIEQKLGDTAAAARYVQRISTEFPPTQATPSGDAGQR